MGEAQEGGLHHPGIRIARPGLGFVEFAFELVKNLLDFLAPFIEPADRTGGQVHDGGDRLEIVPVRGS